MCLHIDECRCALAAASADSSARLIGGPARAVTDVRVGDGDVSMALVCSACWGLRCARSSVVCLFVRGVRVRLGLLSGCEDGF